MEEGQTNKQEERCQPGAAVQTRERKVGNHESNAEGEGGLRDGGRGAGRRRQRELGGNSLCFFKEAVRRGKR